MNRSRTFWDHTRPLIKYGHKTFWICSMPQRQFFALEDQYVSMQPTSESSYFS